MLVNILLMSIGVILVVELFLTYLILFYRKKFQWLIVKCCDLSPKLDRNALGKFLVSSYDSKLGWIKKAGTSGRESRATVGEHYRGERWSAYEINSLGARMNLGHEDFPAVIATYGDSFTFSRQVNDDQTWQWFLSEKSSTNVINFGVGNYGIDQAVLRFEREVKVRSAPVAMLGVVPETIVRILSVWRHYYEYGNTFAFKPRFDIRGGALRLIDMPISSPKLFDTYEDVLPFVQEQDYFFDNKFRRELLEFPYVFSVLKSFPRNIALLSYLVVDSLSRCVGGSSDRAWAYVLKRNQQFVEMLYAQDAPVRLLKLIINLFHDIAVENNVRPVFMMMPYMHDVLQARKTGLVYYADVIRFAREKMMCIDITESFLDEQNLNLLYVSDFYGAHLSVQGNQRVANLLYERFAEVGIF